jgi:Arf-GAP/coiled-coil/ANK repeat/PH domain-containing protein
MFKDTVLVFMSRQFTSVFRDIKAARESRHYFEKISVDLDGALSRNSQAPRSRLAEAEEAQNLLCATRSCFRHTALDYVYCLSVLQAKKKPEVLGTVSSPSELQVTPVLKCLSG